MKGFVIGLVLGGLLATGGSLWATHREDPLTRIERWQEEQTLRLRQRDVENRINRVLGREC